MLPPARLGVRQLPLQPEHVDEEPLGEAVLAHHPGRGPATRLGQLKVAVIGHGEEAVALHPRDRLRHRRPRMPQALGDASAQRQDPIFLELEDGPQIHLRGVDHVGHGG